MRRVKIFKILVFAGFLSRSPQPEFLQTRLARRLFSWSSSDRLPREELAIERGNACCCLFGSVESRRPLKVDFGSKSICSQSCFAGLTRLNRSTDQQAPSGAQLMASDEVSVSYSFVRQDTLGVFCPSSPLELPALVLRDRAAFLECSHCLEASTETIPLG